MRSKMQLEYIDMAKSAMMTVRLTPELSEKLEVLARDTKRSKSYLASEAIASYVDRDAWQVARIKEALAEAKSGAPGVPHAEVVKWMESWVPSMSCHARQQRNPNAGWRLFGAPSRRKVLKRRTDTSRRTTRRRPIECEPRSAQR